MRKVFLVLILYPLFAHTAFADAGIYKCTDQNNNVHFSDQECTDGIVEEVTISPNVVVNDYKLEPADRVIYLGDTLGTKNRFIRVSIYEETDEYMIFEVIGYYAGPEGGKLDFRVNPNIPWRAQIFESTQTGINKGYARVQLNDKGVDGQVSDIISLSLWYYDPKGKAHYLNSKTIPYKKTWKKPKT